MLHDWNLAKSWGVIIGVSRCKNCGKLATVDDFATLDLDNSQININRKNTNKDSQSCLSKGDNP